MCYSATTYPSPGARLCYCSFSLSFGTKIEVPGKAEGHERRLCAAHGWRTQGFSQHGRQSVTFLSLLCHLIQPGLFSTRGLGSGQRGARSPGDKNGPGYRLSLGWLLFHCDPAQRRGGGELRRTPLNRTVNNEKYMW